MYVCSGSSPFMKVFFPCEDPSNVEKLFGDEAKSWLPVDLYVGGNSLLSLKIHVCMYVCMYVCNVYVYVYGNVLL